MKITLTFTKPEYRIYEDEYNKFLENTFNFIFSNKSISYFIEEKDITNITIEIDGKLLHTGNKFSRIIVKLRQHGETIGILEVNGWEYI